MRLILILGVSAWLSACSSVESRELYTGVRASDQAAIRAAARAVTNSPITNWQLWPDRTKPIEVIFYTEEGKIYSAKKIDGKWHITDITNAIVRFDHKPPNQSPGPTAGRRDAQI